MLKKLGSLSAMRLPTWELQGQIDVAMRSLGLQNAGMALLDSGATHVFRSETEEDVSQSEMVHVQLADGQLVALRQNRAGTLMPVRTDPGGDAPTTIIPLGALVATLGCSLEWSTGRGLVVEHPEHGVLRTFVAGNCPMVAETQALTLIQELEDKKLRQLHENTGDNALRLMDARRIKNVDDYLWDYVCDGRRGTMSLVLNCEGGPFAKLPGPARAAVTMDVSTAESAGKDYLKALPIKRKMRRALLEKKWIVHLYAGDTTHEEFKVLENDQVMILETDVARSRGFNLRGWSEFTKLCCGDRFEGRFKV